MVTQLSKFNLNSTVVENYNKVKASLFLLPLFFLIIILLFLYYQDALSVEKYVQIQKDYFLFINSKLSQFPNVMYNITQIGDALIFLSFLSLLIIYAPKIWEALLAAFIASVIFSRALKETFNVPRPAEALDNNTFTIIGKKLVGFSSLPSGHSITTFTILTVLMFAFMPKKIGYKILWLILLIGIGLIIVFSRVGVGAHFPIDVITGSIIGFISGLIGIFVCKNYKIGRWINNQKYYPFFMLLFAIGCIILSIKIYQENLIIYYFSLISLIVSLYKITYVYVKK
jgi:membrane-associated phospholipid phosphatase